MSNTFVVKYQIQASFDKWVDKVNDMATFIKCANIWETPCLDVSMAQIFHGLFGNYLYRLIIKTLKDRNPKITWTMTPAIPNI